MSDNRRGSSTLSEVRWPQDSTLYWELDERAWQALKAENQKTEWRRCYLIERRAERARMVACA